MVFDQLIFNKKYYKIMKYFLSVTFFTYITSIKGSCLECNVHLLFLLIYNQRLRYVSFCSDYMSGMACNIYKYNVPSLTGRSLGSRTDRRRKIKK